jgi:DNA-binding CsgD family transcriptional regulator
MGDRSTTLLKNDAWVAIASSLRLSVRELQIVTCLIEDGLDSDDEIGRVLGMSPHTVHTHLERLYKKIGVASRSHVILRVFAEYVRFSSPSVESTLRLRVLSVGFAADGSCAVG